MLDTSRVSYCIKGKTLQVTLFQKILQKKNNKFFLELKKNKPKNRPERERSIGIDLGKRTYEIYITESNGKIIKTNGVTNPSGRKSLYKKLKASDMTKEINNLRPHMLHLLAMPHDIQMLPTIGVASDLFLKLICLVL